MSANLYIWAGAVLKYCARDLKTQAVHFLPARLALEVLPRNALDKSTYLLTYLVRVIVITRWHGSARVF